MKHFILMAVFALVFITTSAQAADKGLYVSGIGGVSLVPKLDQEISGTRVFETDFDLGSKFAGALGYDYGALRAEVEFGYVTNDANDGDAVGFLSGPVEGDVSVLSVMVNAYYDIHTPNFSLVPYFGVGLGGASIDAQIITPFLGPSAQVVDDDDTVFAYQFMAGLGWNVSPTITLTLDYRYFATTDPEFTPGNAFIPGSPDLTSDYNNHSFNLGARFKF